MSYFICGYRYSRLYRRGSFYRSSFACPVSSFCNESSDPLDLLYSPKLQTRRQALKGMYRKSVSRTGFCQNSEWSTHDQENIVKDATFLARAHFSY